MARSCVVFCAFAIAPVVLAAVVLAFAFFGSPLVVGHMPLSAVRPNWAGMVFGFGRLLPSPPLPKTGVEGAGNLENERWEFEGEGVTLLQGALNPDWVHYMREVVDDEKRSPSFLALMFTMIAMGNYDIVTPLYYYGHSSSLRDFLDRHRLPSMVARIVGATSELRLVAAFFAEGPRKAHLDIGWHRDTAAVGPLDPDHSVRVQMYLDDVGENGEGANEFVLGSHRVLSTELPMWEGAVNMTAAVAEHGALAGLRRWLPLARAGDAVLYHAGVVHRVHAILPQTQRRMLSLTFATSAARWTVQNMSQGGRIIWETAGYSEGDPLQAQHFPRVWPESELDFDKKRREWKTDSLVVMRYFTQHLFKKLGIWKPRRESAARVAGQRTCEPE